jgi:hypothetical protein
MSTVAEIAPSTAGTRRGLSVKHVTRYHYDRPIQRSIHRLHLRPIQDSKQKLLNYRLELTPEVPVAEYEDVFGNWATGFEITEPYTDLTISMESTVELLDVDPFAFAKLGKKSPDFHLLPYSGTGILEKTLLRATAIPKKGAEESSGCAFVGESPTARGQSRPLDRGGAAWVRRCAGTGIGILPAVPFGPCRS